MAKIESTSLHAETMDIVLRLSAYLRDNPLACDSVEGIAQWWLAGAVVHASLLEALERLEACQVIECQTAADGRTRYRRACTHTPADTSVGTNADTDFQTRVQRALGAAPPFARGLVH